MTEEQSHAWAVAVARAAYTGRAVEVGGALLAAVTRELERLQQVNAALLEACKEAFEVLDDLVIEVGSLSELAPTGSRHEQLCERFGNLRDRFDMLLTRAEEVPTG